MFFGSLPARTPVLQVYPSSWGRLSRHGGFKVDHPGDNYFFMFDERTAWKALAGFEPTVLYCQEEISSNAAMQARQWAFQLGCKCVFFVWENQRLTAEARKFLRTQRLNVIAGNFEAAVLHKTVHVLPQVGVDPDVFFLRAAPRSYEVLFPSGKRTREKGWDMYAKLPFRKLASSGEVEYESMGALYGQAKVAVVPSRDTPSWKEQFANYVNVEALFSGCRVVASDSAAMVEWLKGCPGVEFFPRDDYDRMERAVKIQLEDWEPNVAGREWAVARFGTEVVAKRLLEVLEEI